MILVIGGLGAGKRAFVLGMGYAESDCSADVNAPCPVAIEVQELVRAGGSDAAAVAERIAHEKEVAVFEDVGSGVVPVDPDERAWRDRAGQLARELAAHADSVVRLVCGIPTSLKGDLPSPRPSGLQVVIMRHGTTTANERRQYAGRNDVALSEKGEREAWDAGECPHVDRVFVSPLGRARRTAEICFPNARQIVEDDLREMDFGAFEGRSAQEMEHDELYRAWVESGCEDRCPGGERRDELTERVSAAVERIVHNAIECGDDRVIIVGHGGTIMAAMHAFADDDRGYFEWHVGNCEGFSMRASVEDGRLRFVDVRRFSGLRFLEEDCLGSAGKMEPGSSFFQNRACEHFPCHEGLSEEDFNCLFCYCPLYALGPDCGGNFSYTKKGRKNCTACTLPHMRDNGAKLVAERYEALALLASRSDA